MCTLFLKIPKETDIPRTNDNNLFELRLIFFGPYAHIGLDELPEIKAQQIHALMLVRYEIISRLALGPIDICSCPDKYARVIYSSICMDHDSFLYTSINCIFCPQCM